MACVDVTYIIIKDVSDILMSASSSLLDKFCYSVVVLFYVHSQSAINNYYLGWYFRLSRLSNKFSFEQWFLQQIK